MRLWLIADTHFRHARMVELCGRGADFDAIIADNWKRLVAPEDTVIHLGDVWLGKTADAAAFIGDLPGTKVLVRGNHDPRTAWWEKRGFALVVHQFQRSHILYSHAPTIPIPEGITYNVHGHFHNSPEHRWEVSGDPYYEANRSKYLLCHIEDTLAPILLDEFLEQATCYNKPAVRTNGKSQGS